MTKRRLRTRAMVRAAVGIALGALIYLHFQGTDALWQELAALLSFGVLGTAFLFAFEWCIRTLLVPFQQRNAAWDTIDSLQDRINILEKPPQGMVEWYDLTKGQDVWHIYAKFSPDAKYLSIKPPNLDDCLIQLTLEGGDITQPTKLWPPIALLPQRGYMPNPFTLDTAGWPVYIWLSTDARNGNQATIAGRKVTPKMRYFATVEVVRGSVLASKSLAVDVDSSGIISITEANLVPPAPEGPYIIEKGE